MKHIKIKVHKDYKEDEIIHSLMQHDWANGYLFTEEENDREQELLTAYIFEDNNYSIHVKVDYKEIEFVKPQIGKFTSVDYILFQVLNSEWINTNNIINELIELNHHANFLEAIAATIEDDFVKNRFTLKMNFAVNNN